MRRAKIINGIYMGEYGTTFGPDDYGLCLFTCDDGKFIQVKETDIEYIY